MRYNFVVQQQCNSLKKGKCRENAKTNNFDDIFKFNKKFKTNK